jgi:hypothetical protein
MYHTTDITVHEHKKPIITGTRNAPSQPLYNVRTQESKHHTINLLSSQSANATHLPHLQDRIAFYHATLFSPVISTWADSIKAGYLDSFPELTAKQVRKYTPHSEATTMGHQHAQRSNLRSTKPPKTAFTITPVSPSKVHFIMDETTTQTSTTIPPRPPRVYPKETLHIIPDPTPRPTYAEITAAPARQPTTPIFQERPDHRTHHVYTQCETITGQIGSDQTGRFVVPSTSGNNYIFLLYDYDSNSIHAEPIPTRKKESIKEAYSTVLRLLQHRGLRPKLHRLDNEASQLLTDFMTDEQVDYQLTPAGLHRRNWAERANQTFKNHFISGLCSTHPDFPLNLWDKLLPQATLTLNLLRPSRINPQLSAHAQVFGAFNFDKTPLAPPGIKVLAHERAEERESFAVHSARGYYVGPCLNHYRCYRVYIPSTNSFRIANTVDWFPHNLAMPLATATNILIATAKDLTAALRQ